MKLFSSPSSFVILLISISMMIMAMTFIITLTSASTCKSGIDPLPLRYNGNANQVRPGFYAPYFDPTNASTFPVACTPEPVCQALRTLGVDCDEAQSIFEPVLCESEYYCPNATTKIKCPENNYCRYGSIQPTPCPSLSSCPEGSSRPQYFGSLLLFGGLSFTVIFVSLWYHYCRVLSVADSDAAIRIAKLQPQERQQLLTRGIARARIETGEASRTSSSSSNTKNFLDFKNLSVTVKGKKDADGKPLRILKGATGSAQRGNVLAILGPSGAGKTTLIKALLRQLDPDTYSISGESNVDGAPASSAHFNKVKDAIKFVPQDESSLLCRELSIADNIFYASELSLPRDNWSTEDREDFRETIMSLLGLSRHRNTVIGAPGQTSGARASGGQRKRTAIACALAGAPLALVLDEPTSGLDSSSSLALIKILKDIAVYGQLCVIIIIHQPRPEIFHNLDSLLVLGRGGVTAYQGPASHATTVLSDYIPRLNDDDNPADVLLEAVSKHGDEMSQRWENGDLKRTLNEEIENDEVIKSSRQESLKFEELDFSKDETFKPNSTVRQAGFFKQFYLQHIRAIQKILCSSSALAIEGLVLLVTGILLAQGFSDSPFKSVYRGEYSRISPLFIDKFLPQLTSYLTFSLGLAGAVAGTRVNGGIEKILWKAESSAGLSSAAYFLGTLLAAMYRVFFVASLFASFQNFFGLFPFDFWAYLPGIFLMYLNCNLIGMITSLFTSQDYATVIAPTITLFIGTLNGAILSFPYGLKVLSYAYWGTNAFYWFWNEHAESIMEFPYERFDYTKDEVDVSYIVLMAMALVYIIFDYAVLVFINRTKTYEDHGSRGADTNDNHQSPAVAVSHNNTPKQQQQPQPSSATAVPPVNNNNNNNSNATSSSSARNQDQNLQQNDDNQKEQGSDFDDFL